MEGSYYKLSDLFNTVKNAIKLIPESNFERKFSQNDIYARLLHLIIVFVSRIFTQVQMQIQFKLKS